MPAYMKNSESYLILQSVDARMVLEMQAAEGSLPGWMQTLMGMTGGGMTKSAAGVTVR